MGRSDLKDQLIHIQEGREGEKIIREYLISKGAEMLQIDWMSYENKEYRLNEVKHQEIFTPPPFYGHGLPVWQVNARMNFYHRTRIEPWLYIVEKSEYKKKEFFNLIWLQSLINLEMCEYVDSKGQKPRRVYNIKSFEKVYFKKTRT